MFLLFSLITLGAVHFRKTGLPGLSRVLGCCYPPPLYYQEAIKTVISYLLSDHYLTKKRV